LLTASVAELTLSATSRGNEELKMLIRALGGDPQEGLAED
jgi:hypothetical protein